MGKRTKEKSDEEIERKIRRLEEELKSRKQSAPLYFRNEGQADDSFHASSYNFYDEVMMDKYLSNGPAGEEGSSVCNNNNIIHAQCASMPADEYTAGTDYSQHTHDTTLNNIPSVAVPCPSHVQTVEDTIPDEILEALGEAKKSEESFGKKISQGVSERLGKILIDGLAKEQKEMLLSKILVPENFQLAKAPKLNAEVASVLTEPSKNRDKRLEVLQNQLGSGIAGLVNLTSELINQDLDKMEIIKRISEVNQILLDLHHQETLSRRRLIIPLLDKSFITIIQNVKRDQYLFGERLGDNIQNSKSIEKTSLQIKKPVPPQFLNRKPQGQQGNSRIPARQWPGARAQPSTSRYYQPPPPPAPYRRPPPANRRPPPPRTRDSHAQDNRSRRR